MARLHLNNPYAAAFQRFCEQVGSEMGSRTIRAWHYTRLTDRETDTLRYNGIYPTSPEKTRQRLDAQVAAGVFSEKIADALFAQSPFQDDQQLDGRSNRFWMTSHPLAVEDDGVAPLLRNWGGEAVYFWLKETSLKELVASIGKPRVLEVAVPIDATTRAYRVGQAVVATFARTLGCDHLYSGTFDLCAVRSLDPEALLAVHTEGEAIFAEVAKG